MQVKLKVSEAVNSAAALQQMGMGKLPIQVAMVLADNQRKLNDIGEIYNKRRNDLIEELGEWDDEVEANKVKKENIREFKERMTVLDDEEVELEIRTVSIRDLGVEFEVESNVLVALHWMITKEGQKPSRSKKRRK